MEVKLLSRTSSEDEWEEVMTEANTGDEPGGSTEDEPMTVTLAESNDWTASFEELPISSPVDPSKRIEYSVEEVETSVITGEDSPGTYKYEITGDQEKDFTITNTHTPETMKVFVTKVWEDDENAKGKRPDRITIQLLADNEVVDSKVLDESYKYMVPEYWRWTFENLPKYRVTEQGEQKEIEYTVQEVNVTDYKTEIEEVDIDDSPGSSDGSGDDSPGGATGTWGDDDSDSEKHFKVTNTYDPTTTQIDVNKVWEDEDNQDGVRPDSVTVNLFAAAGDDEPEKVKDVTLSEDNNWSATLEDLAIYNEDKEKLTYTVEEETTDVITGEDGHLGLWIAIMLASLLAMIGTAVLFRRSRETD